MVSTTSVTTAVQFDELTKATISAYIASGQHHHAVSCESASARNTALCHSKTLGAMYLLYSCAMPVCPNRQTVLSCVAF